MERDAKAPPDLTATIVKVLHEPSCSSVEAVVLSQGIALCLIHEQPETTISHSYVPNQHYRIVFSFSTYIAAVEHFTEGRIARIYRPWQEMSFDHDLFGSLPSESVTESPSTLLEDSGITINDTTILCSRFVIA